MSAIYFDQVSKQFPKSDGYAVREASFEVEAGTFVVLLGPSGCGKTTTLKMVNRLYEPTSGTIYLDGADIRQLKVTTLRRKIGYVIQQVGLFPHMTVARNIAVVPELLGWSRTKITARVDELLALVDLPPDQYRERYPAQLSGGQQQRVGVARALAGEPAVILMDEPFGAIDAITRTGLQDELLSLQRKLKKTILFVTHDVDEALRLADKIVVMQAGGVIQYDTPFNILTHPANDFVYELIGAGDMVRQLSLLRVESAMERVPVTYAHNGEPAIEQDDNLRRALSLLLQSGAAKLTVLDHTTPVGTLSIENIRASTENKTKA